MSAYSPPLTDIGFLLAHLTPIAALASYPPYRHVDTALSDAVIQAAARLAEEVLGPLNRVGDDIGSLLRDGCNRTRCYVNGRHGLWQGRRRGGRRRLRFDRRRLCDALCCWRGGRCGWRRGSPAPPCRGWRRRLGAGRCGGRRRNPFRRHGSRPGKGLRGPDSRGGGRHPEKHGRRGRL